MKIATFNINNINKRLANLLRWLDVEQPDIVCLQELKTEDGSFPGEGSGGAGYGASGVDRGAGTALRSSRAALEPVVTRRGLAGRRRR